MTRFVLTSSNDPRPSLIVYVAEHIDDALVEQLRQAMFGRGCSSGLAIDHDYVRILQDSYSSMDANSIVEVEDAPIDTEKLLGRGAPNEPLEDRVRAWLEQVSNRWDDVIPRETWAAVLLTDVVPAAAGAIVRQMQEPV